MRRRTVLQAMLPLAAAGRAPAAPATRPELSFGLVADPQFADRDPAGTRFYRNSVAKLEAAVAALNAAPLQFVVTLGDIIDTDLRSFQAIMPVYRKLRAPHRAVPGNHDFDVADADKARVLAAMGLAAPYGSEVHGRWRLLYLDGTEVATYRYPADDPRTARAAALMARLQDSGLPQARSYNSGIGDVQMEWVGLELEAARAAGQRVIVFNHFPVIPAGDPHNLWDAAELVALLGEHGHVAAYFNGHNHAGNYGTHGGCHFVNLKGMVETADHSAYAIVRCFADRLEIEGAGLEPDRDLA